MLIILLPIIIDKVQPELKLISDSGTKDYYVTLNKSYFNITLRFNREVVNTGYVIISFYDNSNQLVDIKKDEFFTGHDSLGFYANGRICVDGNNAYSYKIVDYKFETKFNSYIYAFLIPVAIMCIKALLLSYREFVYDNKIISVYSGWFHHILKVDGVKKSEHNSILFNNPMILSTILDDGTKLEATISLTNRITLKANDKLVSL